MGDTDCIPTTNCFPTLSRPHSDNLKLQALGGPSSRLFLDIERHVWVRPLTLLPTWFQDLAGDILLSPAENEDDSTAAKEVRAKYRDLTVRTT